MDRVPIVRQAILADRPLAASVGWTALAIVVPAILRWLIDRGESGVPFITFFPSVVLATVFLGWRFGTATAIVSGVIANRLLRAEPRHFFVDGNDAFLLGLFVLACSVIIATAEAVRQLVRQQDQARIKEDLLKRELLHRVKNMVTVIQSLAALTARNSTTDEFMEKFGSRLVALGHANDLLAAAIDENANLETLVDRAVEPFRNDGNFVIDGPDVPLPSSAVVPLALALHELCTNAVKYGALSVSAGRVSISWRRHGDDWLINWVESGGPEVTAPAHEGLGTLLLRPRNALKDVRLRFERAGVQCAIVIAPTD